MDLEKVIEILALHCREETVLAIVALEEMLEILEHLWITMVPPKMAYLKGIESLTLTQMIDSAIVLVLEKIA
jgi:hypothetical protein